jgi:hypothetical protein
MKQYSKAFRVIFLMSCSLVATSVFSAPEREDKNPLGCRDLGYRYTMKTLDLVPESPEGNPALFFIFNTTTKPILLSQMRKENDVEGMGINHVIPPQKWAALAMDHKYVKYACSMLDGKSNYGQVVDCAESLKVCNFARVKYGLNNRGNFWMVAGNTKNGALREVTNYGVIAR